MTCETSSWDVPIRLSTGVLTRRTLSGNLTRVEALGVTFRGTSCKAAIRAGPLVAVFHL